MRLINRLRRLQRLGFLLVAGFAVVAIAAWSSANAAKDVSSHEGPEMPDPDPYVSALSVTPGSTTPGGTTTYTLTMTVAQAIPSNSMLALNFMDTSCDRGFEFSVRKSDSPNRCDFGLTNVGSSTHSGTEYSDGMVTVPLTSGQATGTLTVVLTGVTNPENSGGFSVGVTTAAGGQQPEGNVMTPATPFTIGTVIVSGYALDSEGEAVANVGIDLADPTDWDPHFWASSDENGYFAVVGDAPTGTYQLTAWPPQDSGLAQGEPVTVNYAGTQVTANYQFAAATKTLTVTAQYNSGGAVTNGQVNAWNHSGGGSNSPLNTSGVATMSLGGGSYEVRLEQPWNEDGRVAVDWIAGQPQHVEFANDNTVEAKSVAITVQKATSRIKGKLVDNKGNPVQNVWIDFFSGQGRGLNGGTDNNGNFSINATAGTYEMNVWTGGQNSDLYFEQRKVTVGEDETINLGTISMKAYESYIRGTATDTAGEPISGVNISGWVRNGKGWNNTQTDASGNYSLGVFAGGWEVQLENHGSGYIYGGMPHFVNVKAGQTVSGIDFEDVKIADATLRIQLKAEDGGSVQDIFGGVGCREAGKGFHDFGGGIHGGFDRGIAELAVEGGKTYRCDMHLPPEVEYSVDGEIEVTVGVGEEKTEEVTLLAHNATIRGFLKDQNGKLVRNTDAEIWVHDDGFSGHRNTRLQPDGSFEMSVRDGTYMIGYWFPKHFGAEESEYMETHSEDNIITVAANGTATKVLVAPKRNATVTGRVLDPDGNLVEGHMWVGASNRFFLEDKLKADTEGATVIDTGTEVFDGEFNLGLVAGTHPVTGDAIEYETFTGLPPHLQSLGWMPPQNESITPKVGETIELDMQFSLADATLVGSVVTEDGETPDHGFVWAWNEKGGFSGGEVWNGEFSVPLTIEDEPWHLGAHAEVFGAGFYESEEIALTVQSKGELSRDFTVGEYRFEVPESSSFSFDAGNAFNVELDGGTRLSVPAGAMGESDTTVNITATPKIDFYETKDDRVGGGFVWDFEAFADGQLIESFNSDVTIVIPFDPEDLALDGLEEDDISPKYFDESTNVWADPTSKSVDKENNTVTLFVDHFTKFGIVGAGGTGGGTEATAASTAKNFVASGYDNSGGPRIAKYDKDGELLATWEAYNSSLRMGVETLAGDGDGNGTEEVWTIPGEGYPKHVRRFDAAGTVLSQFFTYDNYTGRVESALVDVDNDGEDELVLVPSEGPAHVTVWDSEGNLLSQFTAYSGYEGGVVMAVADLDGNDTGEIVLAPVDDSHQVTVWDRDGNLLSTWSAYPTGAGGVSSINAADMDGDGTLEVLVGANENTSMTRTFSKDGDLLAQWDMFSGNTIGSRVWTMNGDGGTDREVVGLPTTQGNTHLVRYDKDGNLLSQFATWPTGVVDGADTWITVTDSDGDGDDDVIAYNGTGTAPLVRVIDKDGTVLSQWDVLGEGYRGGVMLTPIVN